MLTVEWLESRVLLTALPSVTSVPLDGTWQIQHTSADSVGGLSSSWSDLTIPSLQSRQAEAYAWYRKQISVPASWNDGHVFLGFDAVRYVSDVYINGVRVGGHFGGWEAFDLDITSYYTPGGSDQVLVRVQDIRGVFTDPSIPYDPNYDPNGSSGNNVLAPVGSQPGLYGIWQGVHLDYHRDVYIDNVAITTSVRQHEISATYTLVNLASSARQVTLDPQVMDGSSSVLDLAPSTVTVPAGSTLQVTFSQPWVNPQLWAPGSPHLYYMQASLNEAANPLDTESTRFGFREFWVNGTQFVLNGTPMNFLATAGHPSWNGQLLSDDEVRAAFEGVRSANVVAMRLHANIWPENWYKVADEIGLPIVLESAIWCDSNAYALDQSAFWQNARDHWSGVIETHRNHPSVVMYSIENEIMLCGGERVSTTEKNLGDLGRYVKSLDPTRPIMFEGDDDPDGAADVINLHYPYEFPAHVDYPNFADWLDGPAVLETYPRRTWEWSRAKPLYMGEFLWMFQQSNSGYTGLLGDSAYEDDANRRAKALAWGYQIEAYRKAGLAGIDPWTLWESGTFPNALYDVVKEAYEPNAAFVDEYDSRFFSGQQVQRTIQLYNDTPAAANLTLQWWLNGQLQGQATFAMQPAGHIETTITLTMPTVTAQTNANFGLVVRNGANTVYSRTRVYQVYPTAVGQLNLPVGTRIALFHGDGVARSFLESNGVTPLILSDLANVRSLAPDLLIIEAHALDGYSLGGMPVVGGGVAAELQNFMRGGGTILVLEQNSIPQGLLPVQFLDGPTTIGFVRESGHPVVQGLGEDAFRFWRGDNYVAQHPIQKPDTGGFRILADAGDARGLERVLMLELLGGRGRCVMSQLLISDKLGQEPLAGLMLKRLIEYAASEPASSTQVGVVDADGSTQRDLDALGADYVDLTGQLGTADLAGLAVLLVDARTAEVIAQRIRLGQFVQAGGRVVLHGADAAAMAALGGTIPGGLTVVPSTTVPVLVNQASNGVAAGMMNEDLYWIAGLAPRWDQPLPLDTGVLLGAVARQAPSLADCTIIEAENMSPPPPGTGTVSNGEVLLWTNASIQTTMTLPADGSYYFGVIGHGTAVQGVCPTVAIYLDGELVGYVGVGAATSTYGITAQATAGQHTLRLAFTNDQYNPDGGEDRNVWLDKFLYAQVAVGPEVALTQPGGLVRVDDGAGSWILDEVNWDGRIGTSSRPARYLVNLLDNLGARFRIDDSIIIPASQLQPTSSGIAWQLGSDGVLGIYSAGDFVTNVDFRRSGTYQVTLEVRGSDAAGAYAIAQALVGGVVVGQYQFTDDNWTRVSFTVSTTAGIRAVGVGFHNDTVDPATGDDRNVWVRRVRIRPLALVNAAPTNILLSGSSIAENLPAGTLVAALTAIDPDVDDTFSYVLAAGTGSTDNASFAISGNQLRTASSFDFDTRSSYSIRVRTTDQDGLWVEKAFTITVLPVSPHVSLVGTPQITWRNLGQKSYEVVLHFTAGAAALDLSTINGDELSVTGPGGAVAVTLVGVTAAADGMSADATYRLGAPGGRWDGADNGNYALGVPVGSFADAQGHQNWGKSLGQMGVSLPGAGAMVVLVNGTPNADTISITLTDSGYTRSVNGMGFSYAGSSVRSILVSGLAGNDRITINGEIYICEVSAGAGNDTVEGGLGDDLIRGDEDNDVITGNLGEDTLYGNFGNDSITGAEGADSIMGGLGADTLDGGLMDDSIYGGDQMDLIHGREGADYIEGRGKADTIYGGAGNDTILGGAGSDSILGDDGDDRIWVGLHLAFADTVNGGAGTDTCDGDANDELTSVESVLA